MARRRSRSTPLRTPLLGIPPRPVTCTPTVPCPGTGPGICNLDRESAIRVAVTGTSAPAADGVDTTSGAAAAKAVGVAVIAPATTAARTTPTTRDELNRRCHIGASQAAIEVTCPAACRRPPDGLGAPTPDRRHHGHSRKTPMTAVGPKSPTAQDFRPGVKVPARNRQPDGRTPPSNG